MSSSSAVSAGISVRAVLYQGFEDYIRDHYLTKEESLQVLSNRVAKSCLLRGCTIVFDGFTGFTPSQISVISELMRLCGEVVVTLTIGAEEDP